MRNIKLFYSIGAIALLTATTFAFWADKAIARKKTFSFGSSASAFCFSRNVGFTLSSETTDGTPIVDTDPSPDSGLFKGAVQGFSLFKRSSGGDIDDDLFSLTSDLGDRISAPCDETSVNIPSLDLRTRVFGNSVSYSLIASDPYEIRFKDVILELPNDPRRPPFIVLGTQESTKTVPPGSITGFSIEFGVDENYFMSGFNPNAGIPLTPKIQNSLTNSLALLDFIDTIRPPFGPDANQQVFYLDLFDPIAVDNAIDQPVDVPEPGTIAAMLLVGAFSLIGWQKRT
jgi:hypothetical protein